MPYLSTPYHQCATVVVDSNRVPIGHCQYAAYKRFAGKWLCKSCTRRARARAQRSERS